MDESQLTLQDAARRHLLLHFSRNGPIRSGDKELLVLERGEGPFVFDTKGRRYIDALSSLFCSQLGYSYGAEMAEAAKEELERLPFWNVWGIGHPSAIRLAERVANLAPPGLNGIFFTGGGSESVESAWKIVRQYHVASGQPQRTKAISRKVAYHGVTLGALALTGVPKFKEPFGNPALPVRHVSSTNAYRSPVQGAALTERLLAEIEDVVLEEGPETIAMMIAEPVQNAGGSFVPPEGYWPGLRRLADKYGFLLVADEVITGFGRVGEWFASTRYDADPDLITVAKGLTSAYAPMGAVIVRDRVAARLSEGTTTLLHGLTFAGHPLCAGIALRNLDILERDRVLENVRELEGHLESRWRELLELPIVGDVRGDGFFWSAELVKDDEGTRFSAEECEQLIRGYLPKRLLDAGVIARPDDRGDPVVQVAPPLITDADTLDLMVDSIAEVLADAGEHMGVGARATARSAT